MKRMVLIFIATLFLSFIYSCEGERCAKGTICDATTNQLIDSVKCEVERGMVIQFSDSIGQYFICNRFGGCVPKCPDIEVTFSKVGYQTITITNPKVGSIIYLERE